MATSFVAFVQRSSAIVARILSIGNWSLRHFLQHDHNATKTASVRYPDLAECLGMFHRQSATSAKGA